MKGNWIKRVVGKISLNDLKAPGVYGDTGGQTSVEWIGMALAVLIAILLFVGIISGIITDKGESIRGKFPGG